MQKRKKQLSLAVFIDAFGWELMQRHSFMDDTLIHKSPLQTIFGYSATCDPTILTGKLPREHGHFSFFAYDPKHSPFKRSLILFLMRFVPKQLSSRNRVRSIVSRILKRQLKYSGYFNLYNMPFALLPKFDYTEKRDLYQPHGINSGCKTIMDYAREHGIDHFLSDWQASEKSNLAALKAAIEDPGRNCSFAYLYLAAMDAILHQYGNDHQAVADKIRWYEQQLNALLAAAGNEYEEVRLFIFSDHGMTDVHATVDLRSEIAATGLKFDRDYAAVYDSTMARFWFLNDHARQVITRKLETVACGHILQPGQLHAWGVDFPDNRYGDLFFLLDPGVLLIPSHMGERPIAGMHGYAPEDPYSTAAFATNTELQTIPQRLDDLYHLMKREMDLLL